MGWRVPFIIQTFTATLLAIGMPFVTYSPRWLISKGRIDEAKQVIDSLVAPDLDNEKRELLAVPPAQLAARNKSQLEAMKDIWQPGVRGRTVLGVALNVFQQLSGIDFVRLAFSFRRDRPTDSAFASRRCSSLLPCSSTKPAWTRAPALSSLPDARVSSSSPAHTPAPFTSTASAVARSGSSAEPAPQPVTWFSASSTRRACRA